MKSSHWIRTLGWSASATALSANLHLEHEDGVEDRGSLLRRSSCARSERSWRGSTSRLDQPSLPPRAAARAKASQKPRGYGCERAVQACLCAEERPLRRTCGSVQNTEVALPAQFAGCCSSRSFSPRGSKETQIASPNRSTGGASEIS